MKKKTNVKNIIGIFILILLTGALVVFGYRVVVTADELPGKLGCVATAAENMQYYGTAMAQTQKVDYDTMKYVLDKFEIFDKKFFGTVATSL